MHANAEHIGKIIDIDIDIDLFMFIWSTVGTVKGHEI